MYTLITSIAVALMLTSAVYASDRICYPMTKKDTLIIHGRKVNAECYLECTSGHWVLLKEFTIKKQNCPRKK